MSESVRAMSESVRAMSESVRAMSEPTIGRTGRVTGRTRRVHQVNVSKGGVPKLAVERGQVHRLGLEGDGHDEPEPIHRGVDQAVSLYGVEALARVAADGHTAFPGAFGENLTLEGLDWAALTAGDRLAIGGGGLEVEPDEALLALHDAPARLRRRPVRPDQPHGAPSDTRWYARVLREGPVAPGDRVEVAPGDRVEVAPGDRVEVAPART